MELIPTGEIFSRTWDWAAKHVEYVRKLKQNHDAFSSDLRVLKDRCSDVQRRVEIEEGYGKKQLNEVATWLYEVSEIVPEADRLSAKITRHVEQQCCIRSPIKGHKFGKALAELMVKVDGLKSQSFHVVATELAPSLEDVKHDWDALDRALKVLKQRKADVLRAVDMEECKGNIRLDEVAGWLQEVESVKAEAGKMRNNIFRDIREDTSLDTSINVFEAFKAIAELTVRVDGLKSQKFDKVASQRPRYASEKSSKPTFGTSRIVQEVLSHLQKEDIGIVGLHGLGGIGKTTILTEINNELRRDSHDFDYVIYVTVSRTVNLAEIQNSIGDGIGLYDEAWRNKTQDSKASDIYGVLSRKQFALLLDDIWEKFELEAIGVPVPSP